MSDYSRNYNFTVKDGLSSGNPAKLIKGSEVDDEFDDVATAIATKRDSADDVLANTLTTRGDLAVQGASAAGRLAIGTADQILSSDGTDPVWITQTGLWEDVSDTTLSSDTDVTWSVADGYVYRVIGSDVLPSASDQLSWIKRISSVDQTAADEYWYSADKYAATGSSDVDINYAPLTFIDTAAFSFVFYIWNAANATYRTFYQCFGMSDSTVIDIIGRENTIEAADEIKIEMTSANMTSGRILVSRQKEVG